MKIKQVEKNLLEKNSCWSYNRHRSTYWKYSLRICKNAKASGCAFETLEEHRKFHALLDIKSGQGKGKQTNMGL